jgi:hypothetical protein
MKRLLISVAIATLAAASWTACSEDGEFGAVQPPGSGGSGGAGVGGVGVGGIDPTSGSGGGDCLASEICDDGIDNDCNGMVDDDCACEPGASETCYGGPLEFAGVGACVRGERYCDIKPEFPTWGPCQGSVLPKLEVCDGQLVDEDCDGSANEDCDCDGVDPVACGTDVGECAAGTQTCIDGMLGPCVGSVAAVPELCNNLDDDCDATIDNGLTQACGSNVGACLPGTSTCSAGQWGNCAGSVGPGSETCNNIDDDCDGQTDEGLTQSCGSNVGVCAQGTQICSAGNWGGCSGAIGPSNEICDLLDNDCDGQTDEGCNCTNNTTQACGSNVGACQAGTQTCTNGMWGGCAGSIGPSSETCNGIDDDCDGQTDENLTQSCGSSVGACQQGTMTCSSGNWSSCVGEITPTTETCNNIDDDCDGLTDESLFQQCGVSSVGVCQYGTSTCSSGVWGMCAGNVDPITEICGNNLDDDCDGQVDEQSECPDLPPTCTCPTSPINSQPLATEQLVASCFDPDGGTMSYQWVVTTAPSGSTSVPVTPNSSTTDFFVDLAGSYTLTLYATDDENNTVTCVVVIDAPPPQDLHVELVWDTAWGDADLHMIQAGQPPAGNWFTIEEDCFFGNTTAAWPPNGPDGNATLDIDDTDGFGPENINIVSNPSNGTYNIGIAYYCQHSLRGPGDPPVDPGDGPAMATVKVFCGGNLVATYGNLVLDKSGRFIHVATIDWPTCTGTSVLNNTWTALVQPTSLTSPLHCALPCVNNNDCGGGEVCTNGTCTL